MSIKAVIFDWGGTLVDNHGVTARPDAEETLNYCKAKGYRIAVASLTRTLEKRKQQLKDTPLNKFFEIALAAQITDEQVTNPNVKEKDELFDKIVEHFRLSRAEILIVDDMVIRGIKYGNKYDHPTVWLQKGKYSNELPNAFTGQPTYIIHELRELLSIL